MRVSDLGLRHAYLGRHEERLSAGQEAVDIFRRLAQARPDTFLRKRPANRAYHVAVKREKFAH
jgi:hypothetical protein